MKKILKNQRGSLVFEMAMGVLILAVAGVALYTVIQGKKAEPKTANQAQEQTAKKEYIELKEIGLKIPKLAGLEDVTSKAHPEETATIERSDGNNVEYKITAVGISSAKLAKAANGTEYSPGEPANCAESGLGAISKYSVDPTTLELMFSVAKKTIGGKYYDLTFADGGPCSNDPNAVKIIEEQQELLKKAFDSAETL